MMTVFDRRLANGSSSLVNRVMLRPPSQLGVTSSQGAIKSECDCCVTPPSRFAPVPG